MHNIKKYSNRKLYDTEEKKFVTLSDIVESLKSGEQIKVIDSNGSDITNEISMKARIKGKFFTTVKKDFVEKLLNSLIKTFEGNPDEFIRIVFELVEEGSVNAKIAHDLNGAVVKHFSSFDDDVQKRIIEIIEKNGFVSREKYEKILDENKRLKDLYNKTCNS